VEYTVWRLLYILKDVYSIKFRREGWMKNSKSSEDMEQEKVLG